MLSSRLAAPQYPARLSSTRRRYTPMWRAWRWMDPVMCSSPTIPPGSLSFQPTEAARSRCIVPEAIRLHRAWRLMPGATSSWPIGCSKVVEISGRLHQRRLPDQYRERMVQSGERGGGCRRRRDRSGFHSHNRRPDRCRGRGGGSRRLYQRQLPNPFVDRGSSGLHRD